jgi:hypothetical protein
MSSSPDPLNGRLRIFADSHAMAIDYRTNRLFVTSARNRVTVVDLGS